MHVFGRVILSAMLVAGIAACDDTGDDSSEGQSLQDQVVDVQTAQVSTACLRELPEPSVESDTPAQLSLVLEDFRYSFEEDRHRYSHNRSFRESAGIGLFIYRGRICVEDAAVCADACVRYRVEPGGSLTQRGHHIATPVDPDRITLEYWARDDAGHRFKVEHEVTTDGTTATVTSQ